MKNTTKVIDKIFRVIWPKPLEYNKPNLSSYIIASNHSGLRDGLAFYRAFNVNEVSIIAKKEIVEGKPSFIGDILTDANLYFVDRENPSASFGAIKGITKSLKDDTKPNVVLIFPSGTREILQLNTKDEDKEAKTGVVGIAKLSKLNVVPAYTPEILRHPNKIFYGEPIDIANLIETGATKDEILSVIMSEIYTLKLEYLTTRSDYYQYLLDKKTIKLEDRKQKKLRKKFLQNK